MKSVDGPHLDLAKAILCMSVLFLFGGWVDIRPPSHQTINNKSAPRYYGCVHVLTGCEWKLMETVDRTTIFLFFVGGQGKQTTSFGCWLYSLTTPIPHNKRLKTLIRPNLPHTKNNKHLLIALVACWPGDQVALFWCWFGCLASPGHQTIKKKHKHVFVGLVVWWHQATRAPGH